MKTIAVFGASGRTGKLFTGLALKNEYAVKTLVRDVSRLGIQYLTLRAMQGDALNPIDVEQTIDGTEAVFNLIGPSKGSPPELQRTVTRAILQVMRRCHVRRLIVLGSIPFGILDSQDRLHLINKAMMFMAKSFMGSMVQDARGHIQLVTHSEMDWMVVHAPGLIDDPLRGKYRIGYLNSNTGKAFVDLMLPLSCLMY